MIKKIGLFLFLLLATFTLHAQLANLHSLHSNAQIIEYRKKMAKQNTPLSNRTQSVATPGWVLPFYDEFSYPGPYPDTAKWQNGQSVYVNRTKAIAPPTLGVATFDGLDKYGYPYNANVEADANSFQASDTLLSVPIRLDSILAQGLSPVDSVYLSFYYQAKGYFDKPDQGDYLSLELYSPSDSSWNEVWNHDGYQYDPDSSWHLVMVPITDSGYFSNKFQFRFTNISSAAGDIDHWHLDVIYISNNRAYNDTIFGDFTFSYNLQSPLKNYSQMPFRQYAGPADMRLRMPVFLRNNYNDIGNENVRTYYSFYDKNGNLLYNHNDGNINLGYFGTVGFCNNDSIADPSLGWYSYPILNAVDTFLMKFYLEQTAQDLSLLVNDTISFTQCFDNYYAYDDGSAEAGYGVGSSNGTAASDYVPAVRYDLRVADTLRAMDIFFDPVVDVNNIKFLLFNLVVWSDNGGKPGNKMYVDSSRFAYFPHDTIVPGITPRENHFVRYQFKQPVYLDSGTVFYIGIEAQALTPQIDVGFDMNYDNHNKMFSTVDGITWYPFPGDLDPDYRGSLMIRPVFGDSAETASIKSYQNKNAVAMSIYPNPATNILQVTFLDNSTATQLQITDVLGNLVLQNTLNNAQQTTIDVSALSNGVYFIKALTNKGFTNTQKLLITK